MAAGLKVLQNRGFVLHEDSQFYTFERRELDTKLFDQIKIRKDTKNIKFVTYILSKEDGYKEEALAVDERILASVIVFLNDKKKKEKNDENK